MTQPARMDCPNCGEGLQCVLCGADIPSPALDEAAIERGAKTLAGWAPRWSKATCRQVAQAVLLAALEAPEKP